MESYEYIQLDGFIQHHAFWASSVGRLDEQFKKLVLKILPFFDDFIEQCLIFRGSKFGENQILARVIF